MIAVRPDQVYVLMYIGGHCGEFLSQLISHHPGFLPCQHYVSDTNGYHIYYDPPVTLDPQANDLKVVFPTHPFGNPDQPSKPVNGIVIPAQATWVATTCKPYHRRFFFVLFCIKTMLQRRAFDTIDADFASAIQQQYQRNWYYFHELTHWQQHNVLPEIRNHLRQSYDLAVTGSMVVDRSNNKLHYDHLLDVGELFFGNFDQEYQRLLDIFGTQAVPQSRMELQNCHIRNVALVEKHLECRVDDLFNATTDQEAWGMIYPGLARLHRLV